MEKRYWIFIDSDLIDKSKDGKLKMYIALYFSYEFSKEKSGYGMISTIDSKTNLFIHVDKLESLSRYYLLFTSDFEFRIVVLG